MSQHRIVRNIERPSADVIKRLAGSSVATIHEAIGRAGLLDASIRPIQQATRIAGPAVTVSCHPGDNLMIHAAVEMVEPGDILVVTATSASTDGAFGELLATSLQAHGCIGVVLELGIRDVAELNQMGFPAWSRAVHAQGTVKASPGSVNIPVVCAGRLIEPGDVIVADDDGVIAIPRKQAARAAGAAEQRSTREDATRARLQSGELGVDLYGLRELLATLGVKYVEDYSTDDSSTGV